MRFAIPEGVRSTFAWFAFPLIPALLGTTYHQEFNWGFARQPDPRDWGWLAWVILTGPLVGYGFLAGSTLDLPDDPARRGLRGWLMTRSLWVGVGPWVGFLAAAGGFHAILFVLWAYPESRNWSVSPVLERWRVTRLVAVLSWVLGVALLAYGWLFVAWAVIRRARRFGRIRRALGKGLAVAFGFVGSLFGSFWAITEGWRGYFFDPRIAPVLVAASTLALMTGCASTETLGEVRRRELFQAMLMAWLLGLALAWRWWGRSRSGPPGPPS